MAEYVLDIPILSNASQPEPAWGTGVGKIGRVDSGSGWIQIFKDNFNVGDWLAGLPGFGAIGSAGQGWRGFYGREGATLMFIRLASDAQISECKLYFPYFFSNFIHTPSSLYTKISIQDAAKVSGFPRYVGGSTGSIPERQLYAYQWQYQQALLYLARPRLDNVVEWNVPGGVTAFSFDIWSPDISSLLQVLVNKYGGIKGSVCLFIGNQEEENSSVNTSCTLSQGYRSIDNPSLYDHAFMRIKYESVRPPDVTPTPPINPFKDVVEYLSCKEIFDDVTMETNDDGVVNDVRFIVPNASFKLDESVFPATKIFSDYQEIQVNESSIKKYGRRSDIVKGAVNVRYGQDLCVQKVKRFAEPFSYLTLKVTEGADTGMSLFTYMYPGSDVVTQYSRYGITPVTDWYKYLAKDYKLTDDEAGGLGTWEWPLTSGLATFAGPASVNRFGLTPPPLYGGDIVSVKVAITFGYSMYLDYAAAYSKLFLNGNVSEAPAQGVSGQEWETHIFDMTNLRPGGGEWQWVDFSNLNMGFWMGTGPGYIARCCRLYLVVEYKLTTSAMICGCRLGDIFPLEIPEMYLEGKFMIVGLTVEQVMAISTMQINVRALDLSVFDPSRHVFVVGESLLGGGDVWG